MINIMKESYSNSNKIPIQFIIDNLGSARLNNYFNEKYQDNLRASADLAMAINMCVGKGSPARPAYEGLLTKDGNVIDPADNIYIEINNRYYSNKEIGTLRIDNNIIGRAVKYEEQYDNYSIPSNKTYNIRNIIIREYKESLLP